MQIRRTGEEFKPIVVTLETEKEADIIWLTLNMSLAVMQDFAYDEDIQVDALVKSSMSEKFNSIYEPKS